MELVDRFIYTSVYTELIGGEKQLRITKTENCAGWTRILDVIAASSRLLLMCKNVYIICYVST